MIKKDLQYYISYFLTTYIGGERGLSENTFTSYEYTFKILVSYLTERLKKPINKIALEDFNAENIKDFLAQLEASGCSGATRNQRLAAIKSFCRYVQMESPSVLYNMSQILAIPSKRFAKPTIQYLSKHQLELLLNEPDSSNRYGFKDLLILAVLSDSGMRVSELINIKVSDVRLQKPYQIKVHGKGNKDRWTPISESSAELLKLYFKKEEQFDPLFQSRNLFINRSKKPFTRAGITYILQKYTKAVHEKYPNDFPEKLTPHCLRHTKAMLMLEAGHNLIYIRDILGQEHIKTTEIYARVDSKQMRTALETVQAQIPAPNPADIKFDQDPATLAWLKDYCS